MHHPFATLPHISLRPRTSFLDTTDPPERYTVDSPALSVMTQFRYRHPVTVDSRVGIDDALDKMKAAGVRLLYVVDESKYIVGLITTTDIMGELPIKIVRASRLQRADITVGMVMTPQAQVSVLKLKTVENARIGHIIATLKELDRRHMFVVDVREPDGEQIVVGMFSASEIGRGIGQDLREEVAPAHSLAELVQTLGNN